MPRGSCPSICFLSTQLQHCAPAHDLQRWRRAGFAGVSFSGDGIVMTAGLHNHLPAAAMYFWKENGRERKTETEMMGEL